MSLPCAFKTATVLLDKGPHHLLLDSMYRVVITLQNKFEINISLVALCDECDSNHLKSLKPLHNAVCWLTHFRAEIQKTF